MDAQSASDPLLFEAIIAPHRSLSRRALLGVIAALVAGSLFMTTLMARLGAWPAIAFNFAALALVVFLLLLHSRAARARETLRLTQSTLTITRQDAKGHRQTQSLPSAWINVLLEEPPATVPKLLLNLRGTQVEIARALGEAQKRDLAAALTRALHRARHPVFDNPQLR
jgi:uncharacterized membrane protein